MAHLGVPAPLPAHARRLRARQRRRHRGPGRRPDHAPLRARQPDGAEGRSALRDRAPAVRSPRRASRRQGGARGGRAVQRAPDPRAHAAPRTRPVRVAREARQRPRGGARRGSRPRARARRPVGRGARPLVHPRAGARRRLRDEFPGPRRDVREARPGAVRAGRGAHLVGERQLHGDLPAQHPPGATCVDHRRHVPRQDLPRRRRGRERGDLPGRRRDHRLRPRARQPDARLGASRAALSRARDLHRARSGAPAALGCERGGDDRCDRGRGRRRRGRRSRSYASCGSQPRRAIRPCAIEGARERCARWRRAVER